ncbi:Calcium influx-promoting ehs1 [Lecanosticta acicola]|uniref:Calcium influx-promoting ehs1 n=1 Tax=Lecanosticta acicola TaxID=111012 RepID=A0AAI8YXA2_9PEZI|nr:Calcium influx-promoting ehs1 [Lecanosticta acicola]
MLCQMPKLTPLQSRLAASISALALVALIYWSLSNPHFAYAAELPHDGSGNLRSGDDHNWHRIRDDSVGGGEAGGHAETSMREEQKESHVARATENTQFRGNNIGTLYDVSAGGLAIWEYPKEYLTANHTDAGPGLPSTPSGRKASFQLKHHELRKRGEDEQLPPRQSTNTENTIYISGNTCSQPLWSGTETQTAGPPQLTLYVSTASGNKDLGPSGSNQQVYPFDNGFVNASVPSASGDWYVAVAAPQLPTDFTGSWNYQLAASIDGYFHSAEPEDPFLYLVDTDSNAALLVTDNLTEADASDPLYKQWMNLTAPFIIFATNQNITGTMGLENSFCGLQTFAKNYSQIQASQSDLQGNETHVEMGMITRGLGKKPKEQFYITNLNRTSQYTAYLAMDGNSTASGDGVVGGGGKVWGAGVDFTTKSDGNCQLMFNLTFCDEVAYAVPANPTNANYSSFERLQFFYENYTTSWYPTFNYTLSQVACNTTADARYSLAKNCTNCAAAYKEWLCAVSIPRCEDFSNQAPYLQVRNVGQSFYNNASTLDDDFLNQQYVPMSDAPTIQGSNAFQQTYASSFATNRSRNLQIDAQIRPGPYKEVKPCEDLCYSLMQSCPASMNFACPYPGRGLEASYGFRDPSGVVTCSYLGAVYYQNGAAGFAAAAAAAVWRAVLSAIAVGVVLYWR